MKVDIAEGVSDTNMLMTFYIEDNTSQDKSWIFDSYSTVHVCPHKELFNNSLVAKKEGIVKIVDGSAYEVIGTWTVKFTGKWDGVCALKAIRMFWRHGTI